MKMYKNMIKIEKEMYVTSRKKELIYLGKLNPKIFWRELQQKKKQTDNNISATQWLN